MTILKKYIHSIVELNQAEWTSIQAIAVSHRFKKGELLVSAGDKYDNEVFVEKGVIRAYLPDKDGNEKSTAFFQQGEFMSIKTLRIKSEKSIYSYQALCDTTAIIFNSQQLKIILSATNKLSHVGKVIKEKEMDRLSEKESCLMPVKAHNRYLKFIEYYPKLESMIAQHYIASYLGITPVSLSRLKKKQ